MSNEYRSPEIDKLAAALAKAQAQLKTVTADKLVSISTRSGSTYKYKYAPLSSILDVIRRPLADNGLSISQPIVGNELITVLMHESGQYISSSYPLPRVDDIKAFGANISYIRRYQISPLVGIAVDEEDDENVAGETKTRKPNQQAGQPISPVTATRADPKAENGNGGPATNGNASNIPNNPQALLTFINARVEATYDNLYHLENAIRQELGKGWKWPRPNDADGWKAAYEAAHKHALGKVASPGAAEMVDLMNETDESQADMFSENELDEAFPRGGGAAYQD